MDPIPPDVTAALEKLDESEKAAVLGYIENLKKQIKPSGEADESPEDEKKAEEAEINDDNDDDNDNDTDEAPFPPMYSGPDEDFDKAGNAKQEAADLKGSGDWEAALAKYTEAVLAAPPSALLYANRAMALLKLDRPKAAERDCDAALKENPDSAKALRVRGKARKQLGKYELALKDLSAAQAIDFDEGTVEDLKFLSEKHQESEKMRASVRVEKEEKLRQRAESIKKARKEQEKEEAAAAAEAAARGSMGGGMPDMGGMGGMPGGMGGMPGGMGGMPGGMPGGGGMPNMADVMSDPEVMAAMQNPKFMAAMQELMSGPGGPMGAMQNPAKLQELMSDPEVGPALQKLMSKFGGMGGGAGMGGMPTGGASPYGGAAAADNDDDDDIPDLEDLPELD